MKGGVILVVGLGGIKGFQGDDLSHDGAGEDFGLVQLRDVGFGNSLLLVAGIEDGGAVLAAVIWSLPVQLGGIVRHRFFISRLIPQMTRVALETHKKDLIREKPDFARQKFLYRLSRSDYEREWGKTYTKSGLGTRILATILRCIPKVGPFKGLGFNNPTPQTEDLYIKSIDIATNHYRAFLEGAPQGN